jgi:hypothetical protein
MTRPDEYLVRVSRELLDNLLGQDSEPVVIVSVEDLGDGTYSMWLRTHECPGDDSGERVAA